MSDEEKGIFETVKEKVSEYAEVAREAIFGKPEDDRITSGAEVLGLPVEETVSENLKEENEPTGRILLDKSEHGLPNEAPKIRGQNFEL